ncbi:MAG: GNAT family N-acetyltransferase [Alphaproteobacteria bacterium]|nr:MAG: GNAT family N-acetyltransferase [Alphaproteobacteria bacterium]
MTDFRDATIADAALLADLSRRSFTETFGHLYRPEDLQAFVERLNEAGWAGELANPAYEVRLAYSDGEPAGFAKLGPITLPVTPDVPALELRQLYLLKPFHGLGIADELMAWLQTRARARGAQELYLSVWSQNERARRFYARYGFVYVGPYAFMVGEQADEDEIMKLVL